MNTKRRDFLRNIALGIAATLLPRILQPVSSEIVEETIEAHSGFDGLIPTIMRGGNVVNYPNEVGNFQLSDFGKLAEEWDKRIKYRTL